MECPHCGARIEVVVTPPPKARPFPAKAPLETPILEFMRTIPKEVSVWARIYGSLVTEPDLASVGDVIEDIRNRRFTLRPNIGKKSAEWMWKQLTDAPFPGPYSYSSS